MVLKYRFRGYILVVALHTCAKFCLRENPVHGYDSKIDYTRKYPVHGYILGVLTHFTALDQLWGDDETLKCGIAIYRMYANDSRRHKSKILL